MIRIALIAAIAPIAAASAGSITPLHSFAYREGCSPENPPVMVGNTLYGTNFACGDADAGSLYAIKVNGADFKVAHMFYGPDGASPFAGLTRGPGGVLLGTTYSGGAYGQGTVFKFDPATNTLTTLHAFNGADGAALMGGLVTDAAGSVYGTTASGGRGNLGTVFRIDLATGAFRTLANFSGPNGAMPVASVIIGKDGALYGTTSAGGAYQGGTVFRVASASGRLTTVYSFARGLGANPYAGLVTGPLGLLYGTTLEGGQGAAGTVFSIEPATGTYKPLYSFSGVGGGSSATLVFDRSGNLVGTSGANGSDGSAFAINPATRAYTVIAAFAGTNGFGGGSLTHAGGGVFYGASAGFNNDAGIFRVTE